MMEDNIWILLSAPIVFLLALGFYKLVIRNRTIGKPAMYLSIGISVIGILAIIGIGLKWSFFWWLLR